MASPGGGLAGIEWVRSGSWAWVLLGEECREDAGGAGRQPSGDPHVVLDVVLFSTRPLPSFPTAGGLANQATDGCASWILVAIIQAVGLGKTKHAHQYEQHQNRSHVLLLYTSSLLIILAFTET